MNQDQRIVEFVQEMSGFAKTAEDTLSEIEKDMEGNKKLFDVFTQRMLAIRGTADQLSLPHISEIAGLGEELSVKATRAESRPQVRRCVGALWDALTTVKYMLEHHDQGVGEEQVFLVKRLENTLRILGGGREVVSEDELEALFKKR